MNTKQRLAEMLEMNESGYISGNAIAESLGITRAAIWKNIRLLQNEGYRIEAVQNRGYRLADDNDVVSESAVRRYLDADTDLFSPEVYQEVTSTNDLLKKQAAEAVTGHCIIAGCQTAGKGRRSRSFYSPAGTGVYLSMLLRPELSPEESTRVTTAAAVAACRAIEECTEAKPVIKWVNDVYINGKKVCGILTEASVSMESGGLDWAVMGIGFNVYEPEDGFPEEIRQIAGSITDIRQKDLRSRLAVSFMKHFYQICLDLMSPELVREYKERSFLIGKEVNVIKVDSSVPAYVLDIDNECRLLVRYENGQIQALSSGEVSVRV